MSDVRSKTWQTCSGRGRLSSALSAERQRMMKIRRTSACLFIASGMLLFTGAALQAQVGSGSGSGGVVGQGGPNITRPGTGQEVTPGGSGTIPEFNQSTQGAPDGGTGSRPGSGSMGAPGSTVQPGGTGAPGRGLPGGTGTPGGGTSSPGTGSSADMSSSGGTGSSGGMGSGGGMGSSGGAGGGGK